MLTVKRIEAARPTDKPRKLTDGKGLFLLIHPNGSKYWRLRYRLQGREKTLALGAGVRVSGSRSRRSWSSRRFGKAIYPSNARWTRSISFGVTRSWRSTLLM